MVAKFRAYGSYAESFNDYARLMKDSPRYGDVIANASTPRRASAQGLQRAGYATDPAYADKLTRVINTTLRLQRARDLTRQADRRPDMGHRRLMALGTKAMFANYAALQTTGNNIANANTPGYSRQTRRAGDRGRRSSPAPASSARA